jgi:hypothetical protein
MALISTLAMVGPSLFQRGGGGRLAPGFGRTLVALWSHLGSDLLFVLRTALSAANQPHRRLSWRGALQCPGNPPVARDFLSLAPSKIRRSGNFSRQEKFSLPTNRASFPSPESENQWIAKFISRENRTRACFRCVHKKNGEKLTFPARKSIDGAGPGFH